MSVEEDVETREFVSSERKELRGIMWNARFKKRAWDAFKVWISTAGVIAAIAVAASTLITFWAGK